MKRSDFGASGTERASDRMETKLAQLRLLATSDVHSNLLSHDYYADVPNPALGLSRTGSLIAAARAEARAQGGISLLLDNGDWLQGTPLAEITNSDADDVPAAVRAFSVLGYDAVGLGNHEFNFGLARLTKALDALPCPAICSNLRNLDPTLDLPIKRCLLLSRALPGADASLPPVRIGLLSVLPPQTLMWDADHLLGRVEIDDMVESARSTIATLRAAGADVVVALAHTGLGEREAFPGMENALRPLAALPGLDALVGGHTHLLLPSAESADLEIPVVMPGSGGSHLGVLDLTLELRPGGWQVTRSDSALRAISTLSAEGVQPLVPEDPRLVAALAPLHARTRVKMAEPVGHIAQPKHSYFSFFGQDRGLTLTAAAQAAALRRELAGSDFRGLPVLSAVAPGKFGGRAGPQNYTDVPAGPLSRRHVADLYVYPNELRCMIAEPGQLRDWLEMSAGYFNQLTPGAPPALLANPERAGHNFDVIFGLDYEIDPTAPARFDASGRQVSDGPGRIRNLRWQGQPLEEGQRFAVAFNSYRSSGGGNFRMLRDAPTVPLRPRLIRDTVAAYVTGELPADPLASPPYPWRFVPNLGVEAIAVTGPGARGFLHELPTSVAQSVMMAADGFLSLRLTL
ncbi:5'-nucleotidase C-terminal domain-containing protein [Phaeobacter sp. HF9A]|uniref:5'-nucleotidase C-terminal domain-containing protein n=1 Tax=Phaeobacter sp. HF9A TaxID=2721561 RepID=UPI00143013D0|nr:5'-nucleotidase C-terminal domain-containing protein [Phaeobacter sp. HF9A]NIZ14158.1 bifunctional metallophosphatase/5'-nucleotidase [Phaeobacter sp. HF9A]